MPKNWLRTTLLIRQAVSASINSSIFTPPLPYGGIQLFPYRSLGRQNFRLLQLLWFTAAHTDFHTVHVVPAGIPCERSTSFFWQNLWELIHRGHKKSQHKEAPEPGQIY